MSRHLEVITGLRPHVQRHFPTVRGLMGHPADLWPDAVTELQPGHPDPDGPLRPCYVYGMVGGRVVSRALWRGFRP